MIQDNRKPYKAKYVNVYLIDLKTDAENVFRRDIINPESRNWLSRLVCWAVNNNHEVAVVATDDDDENVVFQNHTPTNLVLGGW